MTTQEIRRSERLLRDKDTKWVNINTFNDRLQEIAHITNDIKCLALIKVLYDELNK